MDFQCFGSMEWMNKFLIGLASQSPRRQYLLAEAGFRFELIPNAYDEVVPEGMDPVDVPEWLAHQKAVHALPLIEHRDLILTADCIVIMEGEIIGKPTDPSEAHELLERLSGRTHQVVSGVCLMTPNKSLSFSAQSLVTFGQLTAKELGYYVRSFDPLDKAGAYGIQDWIGWNKIVRIEGSYSNIMGLPMYEVYHQLQSFVNQ